jgi:hypothetical protein
MPEIKTKQSFGSVNIAHVSPPISDVMPKAMNVHLTFEEALKLYFGLGQLLGKLNTYKRSTVGGRRAAANLCIYPHKRRITIVEGRLRKLDPDSKFRNARLNWNEK